ncbi:hypothetical protein [Streptomyces sp. TS71-3]|uniref:hypothetical protein n=1 Tax=Streptomyces sp. TS71-3 TaxID=2733862 RepID=UPI001AFF56A0|nr:hypothetical protein [Streptomyces sp. TS71-3]GHJ41252.1 hypothetical protein Sm713_68610 [Streptomyces sp. TS71-3]
MTVGWFCRALRAAVFAAVAVLLGGLGHRAMSGLPLPWWAPAAGVAASFAGALFLAGRERGAPLVVGALVASQAVLHVLFTLAQATVDGARADSGTTGTGPPPAVGFTHAMPTAPGGTHPPGAMSRSMGAMLPGEGMMAMPAGTGPAEGLRQAGHVPGLMDAMPHLMGGMSPVGMLGVHALASLLCGLWLARGERLAFRVLRSLAWRLLTPVRLVLRASATPNPPRPGSRHEEAHGAPRLLLLAHSITSRGPPGRCAAA